MSKKKDPIEFNVFDSFKNSILNIDPVAWCEANLTLDGGPFRINGNGYKPFSDIYRYIGLKAVARKESTDPEHSKPIILVKGRQVGATTMASALEMYFMACGMYGNNGRPPMRIMHLFPTLDLAAAYSKSKLNQMIGSAKPVPGALKSNGLLKSYVENCLDGSDPGNNNMHYKKFLGQNELWIDSSGPDGDRIRGRTVDSMYADECFPYDQLIEIEEGKIEIGKLFDLFAAKEKLPKVRTYNEEKNTFEYKSIVNAWKREERNLVELDCGNSTQVKCTQNHRFLTAFSGWKQVDELRLNELLLVTPEFYGVSEHYTPRAVPILGLKYTFEKECVYDIEVEDNHNFIVTTANDKGGLIAHNCQDIPQIALGASTKILAKAQYGTKGDGIQVYFGTPKQKGTNYWNMWKASDQRYYHLRCEKCDEYFPLYRPDVNWEEIWLYAYIVRCTHCNHEQDKREAAERGKWISMADEIDAKFIGFHFNQLYMPEFSKEKIISEKPENKPINTEKTYQNEVLGEFYSGEGATISAEEIHEKCSDKDRRMSKTLTPGKNNRVYIGFDWGQRGNLDVMQGKQRGQSYSCAVVITAPSTQLIQIEYVTRLVKNDPAYKQEVVEELFRRYGVHMAVGDIGDAYDLTHILQRKYPERFLASRAAPKVTGHIKFNKDIFPREIIFERDYYYSELMGLLKSGNVRFPYGSYEEIHWMIDHCCSMEVKVTMDKAGDPRRRYIKGPTPNDGFTALLNAYLAYKYDITQGFNIKQPNQMKFDVAKKKHQIPAVLGYMRRKF